jgi:hypothetical protein
VKDYWHYVFEAAAGIGLRVLLRRIRSLLGCLPKIAFGFELRGARLVSRDSALNAIGARAARKREAKRDAKRSKVEGEPIYHGQRLRLLSLR